MTDTQQPQSGDPSLETLQIGIIEEVAEVLQAILEDPEEGESSTFADALKAWFDNQMQELHDSRGDAEYQADIIKGLRSFQQMVRQIKAYDFGMEDAEEWIGIETLPEDLYTKALRAKMPLLP